jgi:hypothetical protein
VLAGSAAVLALRSLYQTTKGIISAMTAYLLTDRILGTGVGYFVDIELLWNIDNSKNTFAPTRQIHYPAIAFCCQRLVADSALFRF